MDAIIKLIEDWTQAKDNQQSTQAIFFDFAKAFDLVDHRVLLKKLSKQLPEWIVSWIALYLTDRQHKLVTQQQNGKSRSRSNLRERLWPYPFLSIHCRHQWHASFELLKWADDIMAYLSIKKHDEKTKQAAYGIVKWYQANKIRLKIKKCQKIKMTSADYHQLKTTKIYWQDIDEVYSYKYLGININADLIWNLQWEHVYSKIISVQIR